MKKFMFYFMVLNTFIASVIMIISAALGTSLPAVVLCLRGALIAMAVYLVVKKFASWVRRSEIAAFYLAEAAVVVFHLIYLSVFSPAEVSLFEFAITGTLVTPVLNSVMVLFLQMGNKRYAIPEQSFREEPAAERIPARTAVQAAKQI